MQLVVVLETLRSSSISGRRSSMCLTSECSCAWVAMARRRSFSIHSPFVSRCFASHHPDEVPRTARSRQVLAHPSGQAHPTGPRPVRSVDGTNPKVPGERAAFRQHASKAERLAFGIEVVLVAAPLRRFDHSSAITRSCDRWPAIRKASSDSEDRFPTTCALSDAHVGRPRQATRWGTLSAGRQQPQSRRCDPPLAA